MGKKPAREKPLYGARQNIIYTVSNMWKWDKTLVFLSAAQAPLKALQLLSGLYIVRLVISLIDSNAEAGSFIVQVSLFFMGMLLLNILNNTISAKIHWRQYRIRFNYMNLINHKTMDTDYENIESPDGMTMMQKASQTINSDNSATQSIMGNINDTVVGLINLAAIASILTSINLAILLTITALTLLQHLIHRSGNRWDYIHGDRWAVFYRKLGYINNIAGDFERAKDIRLYNLRTWLHDVFTAELHRYIKWEKTAERHAFVFFDISYAVTYLLVCNGLSFAYLVFCVLNGSISIADAVFYFSAIGTFSGVLSEIMFSFRDTRMRKIKR